VRQRDAIMRRGRRDQRMRLAKLFVLMAVTLSLSACVAKPFGVQRCVDLRQVRDGYFTAAAAATVVTGTGGVGTLAVKDDDRQKGVAWSAVGMAVTSVILSVITARTESAYNEEHCSEKIAQAAALPAPPQAAPVKP
jgi:hypothetical protein